MKIVKVVMLGSRVQEYEVSQDPTINGLKTMIEENDDEGRDFNGQFTKNGVTLNGESTLNDGDKIYYSEKLKGNQLQVKVIRIGAAIQTYAVSPGATIRTVLEMLPESNQDDIFDENGNTSYEIRIGDGQPQDLDTTIPGGEGDEVRLILSKRIKGNE